MTPSLFGTDGIRARFGDEPLVESTMLRFGAALADQLRARGAIAPPQVLIGGDTRASTAPLVRWICAGLAARGARAIDLGTFPTGGVALLVPQRRAAAGLIVSASHNPAADNGLKLVGADGFKWDAAAESELERRIAECGEVTPSTAQPGFDPAARADYLEALLGTLEQPRQLDGLAIALDCANGAASAIAGELFERAGARVELFAAAPNGTNINLRCGSTHPEALRERLADGQFDLGFAFDGDADRALLLDGTGQLHDGDAMLYLWATDLARRGELAPARIVATSMSNLGLEHALGEHGIGVERCDVGDRAVVQMLRQGGLRLGGEQSGHLVDLRQSTSGDGLRTALVLAQIVAREAKPLGQLLAGFRRYPQLLLNVRVGAKPPFETLPAVTAAAAEVERQLGGDGRLVLRYSGTEPLARIMLEGPEQDRIEQLAEQIAATIRSTIGVGT